MQDPLSRIFSPIGKFFLTVVKSCYDMEWYRTVRVRPWTAALRYAIVFHAALMLFAVSILGSYFFGAETAFIAHVSRTFPNGAALSVKSGHLSTNLPEPFEAGSSLVRVVFDTSVEGYDVPAKYDDIPGFVVGRDAIFFPKPHFTQKSFITQRHVYRMEDFSEFSVTKAQLLEWLRRWGALFILGALVMFALLYWGIMLLSSAAYVAVTSIVAMALGRLWGVSVSYAAWCATGLHAITLPLLVNFGSTLFDVRIPYAFTFIYFMFVAAVIADERSQPVAASNGGPTAEPPADHGPVPPPPASGTKAAPRTRKIARRPRKKPPTGDAAPPIA